jgi:hypothetical protein
MGAMADRIQAARATACQGATKLTDASASLKPVVTLQCDAQVERRAPKSEV